MSEALRVSPPGIAEAVAGRPPQGVPCRARGAEPARRRPRQGRWSPLLWSVLLHGVAISSAWWAFRTAVRPPELHLASIVASVASQASEGETTPPEEVVLPPLPDVVPPPDPFSAPPPEPPQSPAADLPPRPVEPLGPGVAPPPAVPVELRTAPRLNRVPPPAPTPPPPRVPPPARSIESVAFAQVEGAVPHGTNQPPAFPAEAAARGWRGIVEIRLLVDETGVVREATIRRPSGYRVFDDAALDAVRRWRYAPARRGGVPIAMYVNATIRFE